MFYITKVINIKGIIEKGDLAERKFFMYLNDYKIWWGMNGHDLETIRVGEEDVNKILYAWSEVKVVETI
jgi:hypothetical protein